MSPRPGKRPHGQLRQSQVITTYGPGALVDLPNHSVIIGGLQFWSPDGLREIHEPRLQEKLKTLLDVKSDIKLKTPPPDIDDPSAPPTGITAWRFPRWFLTQEPLDRGQGPNVRSRRLVNDRQLEGKGRYFVDDEHKKRFVTPVRFVRACPSGHIGDVDWRGFCHGASIGCQRDLWMDEFGTGSDLSDIRVACSCGAPPRPLSDMAAGLGALGLCDGARPWLGRQANESCGAPSRLLVRTASNAYFSQIMSVISLPDRHEKLAQAVTQIWEHYLKYIESKKDLKKEREKKPPVRMALEGYSDEEVYGEIRARIDGKEADQRSVKRAELETLLTSEEEIGVNRPGGDFYARALPASHWTDPIMKLIDRVVLVHRLREVVALTGFTRFDAGGTDEEGELEMGVRRAALATEISWLPAIENRGEGVFLSFNVKKIEAWLKGKAVKDRGDRLLAGFDRWKLDHKKSRRKMPSQPYILLHSLSHLLITAVSLECGYPSSSIRERIYAIPDLGYGILLYTGTSDAEGTLGGLAEVGRHVDRHLRYAIEQGRLCANDPVCAQHDPANEHEGRFLVGAACHGCLLISEPSCEQHNDFLDRTLVIPTLENLGTEFLKDST